MLKCIVVVVAGSNCESANSHRRRCAERQPAPLLAACLCQQVRNVYRCFFRISLERGVVAHVNKFRRPNADCYRRCRRQNIRSHCNGRTLCWSVVLCCVVARNLTNGVRWSNLQTKMVKRKMADNKYDTNATMLY